MLYLLQMGPSKVLSTLPFQIQNSWQLSLFELSLLLRPCLQHCDLLHSDFHRYTSLQHCDLVLGFLRLVYLYCSIWHPSANATPSPTSPSYLLSHSAHSVTTDSASSPPPFAPGCPFMLPASPPPNSLKVFQWNAGGLLARSTELLHFLSFHPVDLICIQESNFNSSSSFRISEFSTLRSYLPHSRSGIFSHDATHASGGIMIFVLQGLSFSELSTYSLSSLDPYSDYVGVNISLNNSSSLFS